MRGCGGERIICSLLSYSCKLSAKTIISTLPLKIKQNHENEVYKIYTTECLRIISENTAKLVGGLCMSMKFSEVLNPKPIDKRTGEEIAADAIKNVGLEVRLN